MNAPARWYREPVAWLLVALPAASVLATFALLRAGGGMPLDSAPEPVRRSAQMQQRDLAADERALALRLSGSLRADGGRLRVQVDGVDAGGLRLALVHPVDAGRDLQATLSPAGDAVVDFDPRVRWRVRLQPADGEWRLVGTWSPDAGGAALPLRPALGPDTTAPR